MPSDAKTPEQKIRRYLERMRNIRAGNPVNEVAYYGALEELLNAVGAELKPQKHTGGNGNFPPPPNLERELLP